jgi:hypothetical protein
MLLPADETKQIEILQRLKQGKIKLTHPHIPDFHFDYARHDNLFINLRADRRSADRVGSMRLRMG